MTSRRLIKAEEAEYWSLVSSLILWRLFNISIRRHIGFRLIVVIVGDKVLDRIIWEEFNSSYKVASQGLIEPKPRSVCPCGNNTLAMVKEHRLRCS